MQNTFKFKGLRIAMNQQKAEKICTVWDRAGGKNPWVTEWVFREVLNIYSGRKGVWQNYKDDSQRIAVTKRLMQAAKKQVTKQYKQRITQSETEMWDDLHNSSSPNPHIERRYATIREIENQILSSSGIPPEEWDFYRPSITSKEKKMFNAQERKFK